MGADYNLQVVEAYERKIAEQRGESWEDQTMRGNRLLTECQQQIVNIPADMTQTASISVPAQATAPDPWVKFDTYLAGGIHPATVVFREDDVIAALAAERASHQAELVECRDAAYAQWNLHYTARMNELATREHEAFMAGVGLSWAFSGTKRWSFDARDDWDPSDLNEAFDAYIAQREKL